MFIPDDQPGNPSLFLLGPPLLFLKPPLRISYKADGSKTITTLRQEGRLNLAF